MADLPALQVTDLRKRYGTLTAVDGLSFHIDPGEVYGLLGPNGAGKSTTIMMIATLLAPDTGQIALAGTPIGADGTAARAHLGVVPQEVALYDTLSGRENLAYFGALYGLTGSLLAERVAATLELLGLTVDAGRRTGTYSGGMKRRLNIGASLLHRPPLVLLDEPTVGVDPQTRNHIFDLVESLAAGGTAFLYTTHYMEEAERLCDRIGVVDHGQLIAEGTLPELLQQAPEGDLVEITLRTEDLEHSAALLAACSAWEPTLLDTTLTCTLRHSQGELPALLAAITSAGCGIAGLKVREPNLERLFLHLTGRTLRD